MDIVNKETGCVHPFPVLSKKRLIDLFIKKGLCWYLVKTPKFCSKCKKWYCTTEETQLFINKRKAMGIK